MGGSVAQTRALATHPSDHRTWTVRVDGLLPLPNRMLAATLRQRLHEKRRWRMWTFSAIRAAGVPFLGRAAVTFARHSSGAPDSSDALPAAFKHCRDALIGPVISDDDDAHLRAAYRAAKCKPGEAYIELTIAEWSGPIEEN